VIAVFARGEHPEGYALPGGRAVGYSLLLVRCRTESELARVRAKIEFGDGLAEPLDHPYRWYGGRFELVATVASNRVRWPAAGETEHTYQSNHRTSIGDNRFAAVLGADELLQEAA
jgi:hypothetical protein